MLICVGFMCIYIPHTCIFIIYIQMHIYIYIYCICITLSKGSLKGDESRCGWNRLSSLLHAFILPGGGPHLLLLRSEWETPSWVVSRASSLDNARQYTPLQSSLKEPLQGCLSYIPGSGNLALQLFGLCKLLVEANHRRPIRPHPTSPKVPGWQWRERPAFVWFGWNILRSWRAA